MTDTIYTLYPVFAGLPDRRAALGDAKDRARAAVPRTRRR